MNERDIINAYCRVRTIDQTIDDDVLDFMKDASIEKLKEQKQKSTDVLTNYVFKGRKERSDKLDWEIVAYEIGKGVSVYPQLYEGQTVKSVLRISDNTLWSVGDDTLHGKINKIEVNESIPLVFYVGESNYPLYYSEAKKPKQPLLEHKNEQPIKPYVVFTKPVHGQSIFFPYNYGSAITNVEGAERFETKEAANVYCKLRKPCINLLEVHEALYTEYDVSVTDAYEKLNKLVEEKIKHP